MPHYWTYLCDRRECPNDPQFVHEPYFGCVPADFNEKTGRSKTHAQVESADRKWRWSGGGCDPA